MRRPREARKLQARSTHRAGPGCRTGAADAFWAAAPAPAPKKEAAAAPAGSITVEAPMPGKVLSVNVKAGDKVEAGDVLLILEAMKMQNEIMAPEDGTVSDVRVSAGDTVATGDVMVVL